MTFTAVLSCFTFLRRSLGVPWEVPWGPLGGSRRILWGSLGAHRDGLPVEMRFLRSRGDPNRQPTGNPSLQMLILAREYRCSHVRRRWSGITWYRSSIGKWGCVQGVWAPPQLLAKAKSAENERRHEAEVRDLTRPGLKAPRVKCTWGGG